MYWNSMLGCTLRSHNTTARHTSKQTVAISESVQPTICTLVKPTCQDNSTSTRICETLTRSTWHKRNILLELYHFISPDDSIFKSYQWYRWAYYWHLRSTSTPTYLTNIGQAIIGDEHPLTSTTTSVFNSNKVSSILQSFGTVRDDCFI